METKPLKNIVNDENGSTSVLVILMMIVLVSLGYFAIASANSNIKLSNNSIAWNEKYYHLDGEGERFVAATDSLLYNAQLLTNAYMDSEAYLKMTHDDLPILIQMPVYEGYAAAYDKEYYLSELADMIYFYYADLELQKLTDSYADAVVSSLKDGDTVLGIITDITLTNPESPDFHLNVSVSVNNYSEFKYDQDNGNISTKRYKISSWLQWQNNPVEETGPQLWDGVITTP